MTSDKQPITIKKYANRRLYNTGTSAYVTLEDLADMVKKAEDFVVYDAKTGDDITRSVLTQIIFEQEGKGGQALMPIAFLRQLIRFYGDSMQMLVPSYLEFTIDKLTNEQQNFRDQFATSFGTSPLTAPTSTNVRIFGGAGAQEHGPVQPGSRDVLAILVCRPRPLRQREGSRAGRARTKS